MLCERVSGVSCSDLLSSKVLPSRALPWLSSAPLNFERASFSMLNLAARTLLGLVSHVCHRRSLLLQSARLGISVV